MRAVRILLIMTYFHHNKIRAGFYREDQSVAWYALDAMAKRRLVCLHSPPQMLLPPCFSLYSGNDSLPII